MALVPGLAVGGTTELAIVAPSGAVLRRLLRPGPDPVAAGDREGRQGLMAEGKGAAALAVPRANVPLAAGGGRRARRRDLACAGEAMPGGVMASPALRAMVAAALRVEPVLPVLPLLPPLGGAVLAVARAAGWDVGEAIAGRLARSLRDASPGQSECRMKMSETERVIRDQFSWWDKAMAMAVPRIAAGTIVVTGCGTSYDLAQALACACNAAGQRAIAVPGAEWARRPESYLAEPRDILVLGLSRSGTTTETVQAMDLSRQRGWPTFALSCAPDAAILHAAERGLYVPTDPREGIVMSVSASLLLLVGLRMAGLALSPLVVQAARDGLAQIAGAVALLTGRQHFVYLGAGVNYGIATEGGLKLQEMSLSYSQSFHPMEYRHGPISLIDAQSLVVMLYSDDTAEEEALVVRDVRAKGARVIGLGGPGDVRIDIAARGAEFALACLPALQMLGEMVARMKGIDSTAPRHLTKVVVLDQV